MSTQTKVKKSKASTPAPKAVVEGVSGRNKLEARRVITGVVVSNKMQKTVVVAVERNVRHRLYKKYVTKTQRYKAHDESNVANVGDLVSLVESRPLSRHKRWVLRSIIRKSGQAPEANV